MSYNITDISGSEVQTECLSCAIAQNKVELRGGSVLRTEHFDVHQDFEIPISGFMILTSLRHVKSVDEFTDAEAMDCMTTLRRARRLQRQVLNIDTVYLHQEEDTRHHFHLWLFPRHIWMKDFVGKSESMRPIMEYAREQFKTAENLQRLDDDLLQLKQAVESFTDG